MLYIFKYFASDDFFIFKVLFKRKEDCYIHRNIIVGYIMFSTDDQMGHNKTIDLDDERVFSLDSYLELTKNGIMGF